MKNTFCKVVTLLLLITIGTIHCNAQDEKFKAIFIYNFTKYIEWPINSTNSNFVIDVIGGAELYSELNNIASKMKVGTKTIQVNKISSSSEITNAQIVYIAPNRISEFSPIIEKAKNRGILVITEKTGLCAQGSGINFITKNGNLNFEISKNNIESFALKVNSALIALGTVVN